MKIIHSGQAGSMESGDIEVLIEANDGQGIKVNLIGKPVVIKQYEKQMIMVINETVEKFDLEDVSVTAKDNGALDYVIRARVEGAIIRALKGE